MSTTPTHEKEFPEDKTGRLPRPFIFRRIHSLTGLFLVLYLFEHLLVNSQMALLFEDDGYGFISMVNKIHQLPYLPVIEIVFLAVPFFVHGAWGAFYAGSAKCNSKRGGDSTRPTLPQYKRNKSFTWQRITAWLLLFAIAAHVVHMRFVRAPTLVYQGNEKSYLVVLQNDMSLYGIADRIHVKLYDEQQLDAKRAELVALEAQLSVMALGPGYEQLKDRSLELKEWLVATESVELGPNQLLADAPSAGSAFLLIVRQAFSSLPLVVLYSIFVVAASYHAFNGVWTAFISWGGTLTRRSQRVMRIITTSLMGLVMFLGLMSAWGTYFQSVVFS